MLKQLISYRSGKKLAVLLTFCTATFYPFSAIIAEDGQADKPNDLGINTATGWDVFFSLLKVGAVLLLVVGLLLLCLKLLSNKNKTWMETRTLRNLGGLTLAQNKSIQLVEVNGTIYVLGIGQEVGLLDKIDDPQKVEQLLQSIQLQTTPSFTFKSLFNMHRTKSTQINEEIESNSFHSIFEQKISNMQQRSQHLRKDHDDEQR